MAALALIVSAGSALAHPHIWIDARAVLRFDDSGGLAGIDHSWTFDDAFSAWAIQGLDTDGNGMVSSPEMQELAEQNTSGLSVYEYYTFAGTGDHDVRFTRGGTPSMAYRDGHAVLDFTLVPDRPVVFGTAFEIEVTDPEYYVAFSFAGTAGIKLDNAPAGCVADVNPPKQLDPAIAERLWSIGADVTELPPDLKAAVADISNVVLIRCDKETSGSVSETAPAPQATRIKVPPFAAPPAEPGLPMPRTGFLAWVNAQQKAFYMALTGAMARLKTDNTAFWLLGGLSFVYGVFHAAGPGHGKVVISSYMLASEAQVRRGIMLSFASAMMQSSVAVLFVIVAALVLNLTSMMMSSVSNAMALLSFGLMALLGLWLIVKKVLGLGHHHHHHHHHAPQNDKHSAHGHTGPARHNWRDGLGVITAVGIRPCSGALVVLVFSLAQGVLPAGIAAVYLMGLGTAITVGAMATLAIGAKSMAQRLAGSKGMLAGRIVWWIELAGAFAVFGFGVIFVLAMLV